MSAGSKIVQLRAVLRQVGPYLAHLSSCRYRAGQECSCGLETLAAKVRSEAANANPARTGGPDRRAPRPKSARMWRPAAVALVASLTLLLGVTACGRVERAEARPMAQRLEPLMARRPVLRYARMDGTLVADTISQGVRDRAKARGDSVLAVAKCWRPVRPLPAGTGISACPDSTEASRLAVYGPLARASAAGVLVMAQSGDTLTMRAVVIRGYVFVGPAHGSGSGFVHSDAVVTAGEPGAVPLTATLNGLVGRATLIVVPKADVRLAGTPELPRYMAQMDSMIASGRAADTLLRRVVDLVGQTLVPRDSAGLPICSKNYRYIVCPPGVS